ncbi:hypothetical protein BDN71DRAFT_1395361 [Pleurotus eryngii]|uniref:Uncharacterized protein n=1 Tax=Pleurotus eryngii TaxID=5323 RepID=A0A9P6D6Q8_PLEER|nr:hypothetical protein BDN71DRAFT_1395361 [Pleurotus eryngii]
MIGLKVEWCQLRACAVHWTEEHKLVLEEMCRVLAYLQWQTTWWSHQSLHRSATIYSMALAPTLPSKALSSRAFTNILPTCGSHVYMHFTSTLIGSRIQISQFLPSWCQLACTHLSCV